MQEITCTVIGNVVSDVRAITTANGHHRSSFRMAVTPSRLNQETGRWVDRDTTWLTVICWRWLAEHVVACVHKGDPVIVTGRLRTREWADGERKGWSVDVDATSVGHDLTRGTSRFERVRRLSPAESEQRLDAGALQAAGAGSPAPGASQASDVAATAPSAAAGTAAQTRAEVA